MPALVNSRVGSFRGTCMQQPREQQHGHFESIVSM
jgi:hypothetical protein